MHDRHDRSWVVVIVLMLPSILLPWSAVLPASAMSLWSTARQSATETPDPTVRDQLDTPTPDASPSSQLSTLTGTPTVTTGANTATPPLSSEQPGKVNWDDFLPPGRGRDLLISNCGTCHPFACAVIGQRTVDRWETLKILHRRRVAALDDEDFDALFAYLEENLNDQMPQPELPPELQGLGCNSGIR